MSADLSFVIEGPPGFVGCLRCHQLVSVEGVWYGEGKGGEMTVAAHPCRGEERGPVTVTRGDFASLAADEGESQKNYCGSERHRDVIADEIRQAEWAGTPAALTEASHYLGWKDFAGPFTMPGGGV